MNFTQKTNVQAVSIVGNMLNLPAIRKTVQKKVAAVNIIVTNTTSMMMMEI